MKRVVFAIAFVALTAHAQTRIASDIEIRQMEEDARKAPDFDTRVSAHVNLSELRRDRNETAASQRELETALQLAREERDAARRDHHLQRYALACSWSGIALASLDRGVEAFAVLEEGVRYGAELPGVWNLYSVAMFRLHRPEKAIGAARLSVAAAERKTALHATVRDLVELNVDRFALAEGLLDGGDATAAEEAEQILVKITESLDSASFEALRKTLTKREEFQIVTAPTTESGIYLMVFNRSHMRLAILYETRGLGDKARREYQAVVSRRSDEAAALAGLARLSSDPKEHDRYLIQSLDANPFAANVVSDYEKHVAAGNASPAAAGGSVGARVRLAIQQIHDRDFRRARETLNALIDAHPNNDVLLSLLARAELESGDVVAARAAMANIGDASLRAELDQLLKEVSSEHPWFLDKPQDVVVDPAEADLRMMLSVFAKNQISAEDRATIDEEQFSSEAMFDAPEADAFQRGTILNVPFRFQKATRFRGIPSTTRKLRVIYKILGATTLDGRDALLIEALSAEVRE